MGCIPGSNSVYWHSGPQGSGTAFHCENMELLSFYLVSFGWKLWIVIRRDHTAQFEAFVRRCWPTNRCDQFARHASVLISPKRLESEGIQFDTILAGPDGVQAWPGSPFSRQAFGVTFSNAGNFILCFRQMACNCGKRSPRCAGSGEQRGEDG